jgi:hypothetical protein
MLPLERGGRLARGLAQGREAALALYDRLKADSRFRTIIKPELDILVWAPSGTTASEISKRSDAFFQSAAQASLHLATCRLSGAILKDSWSDVDFDQPEVTCLRACLMKPEHLEWLDRIWHIMDRVADF